ncbi:MAG: hypothetical protein L6R41_002101 [Letrouitia leprolyta]|nr:MAG: hypothetical protein L6R41_002101 [Letrouitia leprolyta]
MDTKSIAKALGGPTGHFPVEAEIVGYLANSLSVPALLGLFAAGWVVILGTTNLLIKRHNPTLGVGDRSAILWFVLSYFSYNHAKMAGKQDFFGQRMRSQILSALQVQLADMHPLRHPIQALVSLGQIYGDILYYATSMFDHYHKGVTYCRPEAYYFWGYYFFMNFIWIVIPGYLLYSSIEASGRAFQALARQSKSVGKTEHSKKFE